MRSLLLSLVLLFPSALMAQEAAPKPDLELDRFEQQMVEQCNAFRQRCGLRPLRPVKWLMDRARGHCKWMATANSMTHASGVQENIAAGQPDPVSVTNTWINSGGHNANMRTGADCIGVAAYRASNGTIYWCQQFASEPKPQAAVTAAPVVQNYQPVYNYGGGRRGRRGR